MRFDIRTFAIFGVALLVLCIFLYFRGGVGGVTGALKKGSGDFFTIAPLILISFLIASIGLKILPVATAETWMGAASGFKGMLIASGIGVLTPGSPAIDFPIALVLLKNGAGIGAMVAMLVAGKVWSTGMFPVEAGMLGLQFTVVHYVSVFTAPFVAGYIAQFLWGVFCKGVSF